MANEIGYNGISNNSFSSSGSGNKDDFFELGKTVQESISKITLLADAKTNEMLQRLDKDYKAFSKGIQSALNDTSYFREGVKSVDPKSGRSYMEYYVQTSEVENAMSAVRYLISKFDAQNVKYETRSPQQMDYITGERTFEGKQAQAKALYEAARKGGKLIPNPTADNPDQYTYLLPFSTNWAKGVGETDYLDFVFEGSDTLSRLEHDKRASEAEVDRNYAKAKKAEMINKLSLSQRKEAGSIWEQFEKEQAQEDNAKLRDNYALSKQMRLMDDLTASQAKEAGSVWDEFEKEQEKESALALRDNYARTKQMKLMDDLTASQAKEAGSVWDEFEAEEERNRQRDIEVNYQANKRVKRENAQKEAEEKREQDKKQRELERQQAKESLTSKTKRMFLLGQIASMFTVLLDLTRRILSNGLAMASEAKRTEREARNIGASYGAMLNYNYTDSAYGLPEGITPSALFAIQKMFGDPANLDTKALAKLAMVMGNSVGDAVQSGTGGKYPEKLMEMIMNAFMKSQQAGVNQFGQQVGKEEARRNLYTLLAEISPEIATLFSRAVEANDFGINKGRINSWQDYLNANKRIQGNLGDADLKSFTTLGEVVDQLKTKFSNLSGMITKTFLLNLSGVIDRINNLNWGKNDTEKLQDREKTKQRLTTRIREIDTKQVERENTLESILMEYGAPNVGWDTLLDDVQQPADFDSNPDLSPEKKYEIQKTKNAFTKWYASNNVIADSLVQEWYAYKMARDRMNEELTTSNPQYYEHEFSDEGIRDKYYLPTGMEGFIGNEGSTAKYGGWGEVLKGRKMDLSGGSGQYRRYWDYVDIWNGSTEGQLYALAYMWKDANETDKARFQYAYQNFLEEHGTPKYTDVKKRGKTVQEEIGDSDLTDFRKALVKLMKSSDNFLKDAKKNMSKEEYNDLFEHPEKYASEGYKKLAFISLLEGKNKTAKLLYSTAGNVILTDKGAVSLSAKDAETLGALGASFINEQGANALKAFSSYGFTITPVGGGSYTIVLDATINGEKILKEHKDVQLSSNIELPIHYSSDGTTERMNNGNERKGS